MTNCTCHPGEKCSSRASCDAARAVEFGEVKDGHKAIREASDLVSQLVGALELCQRALQSQWSPYLRAGDKEAAAMKAAASALSAAKEGGWQDISTAPKDGTEILLLFGNAEYILGKPHGRVRAACWTGSGSSANWSIPYFKDDSPTAWQPLPAPPAQKDNT